MNPASYKKQMDAAKASVKSFRKSMRDADTLASKARIVTEKATKHFNPIASVQDVLDAIEDAGLFNDPEFKRQLQGLSSICNSK